MKSTTCTKSVLLLILSTAAFVGCGESKKERAMREEAERDRRFLLEYQRQENIQRQRDRDQRAA